jgi:hypothetical protein
MFKKRVIIVPVIAAMVASTPYAIAENVPINGNVQSRCVIVTDTPGVYGNPNAYTLTTTPADGGMLAIARVDITLADAYKVKVTAPDTFSSSPSLPDTPVFTGDTEVSTVSDATGMGSYETNKVEYGMTDEYDMTASGSTWFKTSSTATLGGNKAFPGGSYSAMVNVDCIAK